MSQDNNTDFSSYEKIFGEIDFREGDDARSVLSPAAYLADLLQLYEDEFDEEADSSLWNMRREDILHILLDEENTFTMVPYLDIVNEILEGRVEGDTYEVLKGAKHPINLPFNLEHEKIKNYLAHMEITQEQLYKLFSIDSNEELRNKSNNIIAREYLGLSEEAYNHICNNTTELVSLYGITQGDIDEEADDLEGDNIDNLLKEDINTLLTNVKRFMRKTKITFKELLELLYGNLSDNESEYAGSFYLNNNLSGYAVLDEEQEKIIGIENNDDMQIWLRRAYLFIYLAKKTQVSFVELDMILRSCCNNILDEKAILHMAYILKLHKDYELSIDMICGLLVSMNTLGTGNEEQPIDLFNRIYNGDITTIDKNYIQVTDTLHPEYENSEYTRIVPVNEDDLMSDDNIDFRGRLCKALKMTEEDVAAFITCFTDRSGIEGLKVTKDMLLTNLTLLYRVATITEFLDISVKELCYILDVISDDPIIRIHNVFDRLIAYNPNIRDCYTIFSSNDVTNNIWLIQLIVSITKWMQENDFTGEELRQITLRFQAIEEDELEDDEETEEIKALKEEKKAKIDFLNNLYTQFKTLLFDPQVLTNDDRDDRTSRAIYRYIIGGDNKVVSNKDKGILLCSKDKDIEKVSEVVYEAVNHLDYLSIEDFTNTGLEEKILNKLKNNLVYRGYINTKGDINENVFPENVEHFQITTDFSIMKDDVFDIIANIYEEALSEEESSEDVLMSLYPSDFEELNLSEGEQQELYDNLLFNNYIDEDSNVIDPEFFGFVENKVLFMVNADIADYAKEVYQVIKDNMQKFTDKDIVLDSTIFSHLPISELDTEKLMTNLLFNDYIDDEHVIRDKEELLNTSIEDFNLAIAYYPYRFEILDAIKKHIIEVKDYFYNVDDTMLRGVSGYIVASDIYKNLEGRYLRNGKMTLEGYNFFSQNFNIENFELGDYFTNIHEEIIFNHMSKIVEVIDRYRVKTITLEELGLNEMEREELVEMLETCEYTYDYKLNREEIDYFLNVNNALVFKIERFDDYNKDIFFLLHDIAKEMKQEIDDISQILIDQAIMQEETLLTALQDVYGIGADEISVVMNNIIGTHNSLVEQFMGPVIEAVNVNDKLMLEPKSTRFNNLYRRAKQIAILIGKLGLTTDQIEVAFHDQQLTEKFPEHLILPEGTETFDVILEGVGSIIYLFTKDNYYAYSADDYTYIRDMAATVKVIEEQDEEDELYQGLTDIDRFYYEYSEQGVNPFCVDAAFVDSSGTIHIISGTNYYCKTTNSDLWELKERQWGKVENNFSDIDKIDGAYVDEEGKTYLFSKGQYIRYISHVNINDQIQYMDEGYPKDINKNWKEEFGKEIHPFFHKSIDASMVGIDHKRYLFKDDVYVSSDDYVHPKMILDRFGHVKNNFNRMRHIDAAFTIEDKYYLFAGDQVICYRNNIENNGVYVEEGYPLTIDTWMPELPYNFKKRIDAAINTDDGIYLLSDGKSINITYDDKSFHVSGSEEETSKQWGIVKNNIIENNKVDAAFVGLDGKAYVFSGDQYYRYSGEDYKVVDSGYPRFIESDWDSLLEVTAAFVLDGKTYLCGMTDGESMKYVRYSTNDYTVVDEGYPKTLDDNWWNLPFALTKTDIPDTYFDTIDAVFTDQQGRTYLFSSNRYIYFDNQHRWWSEPALMSDTWGDMPFEHVDAAFTGKDGKVYIFSNEHYISYKTNDYSKIDSNVPIRIMDFWGNVKNNIADTGLVDASMTVIIPDNDELKERIYVFSGNQYHRYTLPFNMNRYVDEGYPKNIAEELSEEPGFENLNIDFSNGIDCAMANGRNMYFFKDGTCTILVESASQVLDKTYSLMDDEIPTCVFTHEGNIYMRTQKDGNYKRCSDLESLAGIKLTDILPPLLRPLDEDGDGKLIEDNRRISSILEGTDGTTYAFFDFNNKDSEADTGNIDEDNMYHTCYNFLSKQEYSIAEEWGYVDNNIIKNNHIDAGLVGVDGNTYLFSGDQYVMYNHESSKEYGYIDKVPKVIEEHFGLRNVNIAYVIEDKTFLLEKPDEQGRFRYVQYSGKNYSKPDTGFPKTADEHWWNIPIQFVIEGFDQVDAVYVEDDNIYLIHGDKQLQYNYLEGIWSYPKDINKMWKNIPLEKITTLFKGIDDAIYFFDEDKYSKLVDGAFVNINIDPVEGENRRTDTYVESLNKVFGKVDNNIVELNRIDASFVDSHGITYLFSGDQYVRYSSSDYRYIDFGYPKKIYENLRFEKGFENLDHKIGKTDDNYNKEVIIQAIIANLGTIYIFIEDKCIALAQGEIRELPIGHLGRIRNNLLEEEKIDAAFGDENRTFIFCGDQYIRYSQKTYEYVDEGYPKSITAITDEDLGIDAATFQGIFTYDLDAALYKDERLYLFKGDKYFYNNQIAEIATAWGKIKNTFNPDEHLDDMVEVDAAFLDRAGKLFVFKDNQYIRYSNLDNEYVDEGYPRDICNNWGNMPINFEESIDGAFIFDNKTYMIKGQDYIRYSDPAYKKMDLIYPQSITNRWGEYADYLLADIKIITDYKYMDHMYIGDNYTLTDFLHPQKHIIEESYEVLSDIFKWDAEEIKWLKKKHAFLFSGSPYEVNLNIELLIKMLSIFKVTQDIETTPSKLYRYVWSYIYGDSKDLDEAAEYLYKQLGLMNSQKDWAILKEQIQDEENIMKRDALVPYLTYVESDVNNSRELYEKLLIDVDMDSCARTSRIKEALACMQLYFHRYFMDLEKPALENFEDMDIVKDKLKSYWEWMKNYRVWEANRKVFLYPENYIRPELRDTKTEQFKTLEDEVMQGELTDTLVEQAYKNYLDSYDDVSRLTVAGGYRYNDDSTNDDRIIIFGRTKTEPTKYYYRTATFIDGDTEAVEWDSWIDTELQIDSQKVYPVYAFGKTFVFWPQVELDNKEKESQNATASESGGKYNFNKTKKNNKVIKINFSYLNLNGKWVIPQTLDQEIKISDLVTKSTTEVKSPVGVELFVKKSDKLDSDTHDNIVINCSYSLLDKDLLNYNIFKSFETGYERKNKTFLLTPELYTVVSNNNPAYENMGQSVFKTLFEENIAMENAVAFNIGKAPWFAFDHKGGSFLCKPSMHNLDENEWPKTIDYSNLGEDVTHIDASFQVDGITYLIVGESYFAFDGEFMDEEGNILDNYVTGLNYEKWGHADPNDEKVKAAFTINNYTYILRNDNYLRFENGEFSQTPVNYPKSIDFLETDIKSILGNQEFHVNLNEINIDSAFMKDGILYVIDGKEIIVVNSELTAEELLTHEFVLHLKTGTAIGAVSLSDSGVMVYKRNDMVEYNFYFCEYNLNTNNWDSHGLLITDQDNNPVDIDASFRYNNDLYLIKGNEVMQLNDAPTSDTSWGTTQTIAVSRFCDMSSVESATVVDNKYLYMFSSDLYIRYTLVNGKLPQYMDIGYPQPISLIPIHASFTLDSKSYILYKGYYKRLAIENGQITNINLYGYKNMAGSLLNIPSEFLNGIDAGVNTGNYLYLFKDNAYVKYDINSDIRPYEVEDVPYDIIRLTSSTSHKLSTKLFTEGLDAFLDLSTQQIGELPKFDANISNTTTIKINEDRIKIYPISETLDFDSANSSYYWELFFHVPFFLAQTLNTAQLFEEAKKWYEFIFDPTEAVWWKFLPFINASTDDLYGIEDDDDQTQIKKYLEDPFDPHAIAALRIIAYEKALVMNYIDNIIDWGDLLFGQYTRESINEARMLYILAYDLLGEKPEALGERVLTNDVDYETLTEEATNNEDRYEFLLDLENTNNLSRNTLLHLFSGGTVNDSLVNPYFFIPENWNFINYWNTVEDRLYKIRHCMNIMGINQPLPLFQPPIDPMALVQAVAGGMSLSQAVAVSDGSTPHYRFSFMINKANELASKVSQFGNDLLATLEKKDSEELSLLQQKQENTILTMTRKIKEDQLQEAIENTKSLEESLKNAEDTIKHYNDLINTGFIPAEIAQMSLMSIGAAFMTTASIAKFVNMGISLIPKAIIGTFTYAEVNQDGLLENFAEATESSGESINMLGEIVGMKANLERMKEDWRLQLKMAKSEKIQLQHQINGSKLSESIAQTEIDILEEEIRQNDSVNTFMKNKFTNKELYNWMAGKLSTLYFKTYKLAHKMAKSAQKAFQYERGIKESEVNYISSMYWDSLRKGLLAGESLGYDLDRMEQAYIESNSRDLEIAKPISLLELDPFALVSLKEKGVCEFNLTESLFDYDFQGHYGRQVKTISVVFDMGEGKAPVNATLTQLSHKTIIEPDVKAVKYMIDPKDVQPTSIRSDWRVNQQIVLSPRGEYEDNNGLFELRYDDERYLPFEGTGAVSRWRLELNGKKGSYNPKNLKDVIVNLKYTAKQGGQSFGDAVRGMLKPYHALHFINMAEIFGDSWTDFLQSDDELAVTITRDMLPNMAGSKIDGIYMVGDLYEEGKLGMILDSGKTYNLESGKYVETSGLSISSRGSQWSFTLKGDKHNVKNVGLIIGYKASV
ncbi:hemopexin repeat-containing protein [Vallitalea guaymasensis]|uniref:Tc toxin subunit A-related protein n=1 Tax=Vallitalea guaymasensis TaxID=1185412 RepID=UPI0023542FF1|nr:hemopexin repeat-containing protein [Vallitalea guaymasensis]